MAQVKIPKEIMDQWSDLIEARLKLKNARYEKDGDHVLINPEDAHLLRECQNELMSDLIKEGKVIVPKDQQN